MCEAKTNYFTCTLGEALTLRKHSDACAQSFQTVLHLIEHRARETPNSFALGFANPQEKPTERVEPDLITFAEVDALSRVAASVLGQVLSKSSGDGRSSAVGLFCYSSLDLVLSWLGILRLGRAAFFFAPQLEANAIEHLCQESGVREILVDDGHKSELSHIQKYIKVVEVPSYHGKGVPTADKPIANNEAASTSSVVFLQHTSGTSSGLPKALYQTEWGAVGCLPVFTDPNPKATFTTTPFYHGGVADALRAWTSEALIWFFPEKAMPITSDNIVLAVNTARRRSKNTCIEYFSSVPYVLQMLLEVEGGSGLEILQSMDLVGVGGAPLPPAVGDELVKSGVQLLSRTGSAECGFLMSSHRRYKEDREWQYLRVVDDPDLMAFEPRKDGSYATSDLFEPHPQTPNAWRYHGRADALIALANGKKFDPQPIEDVLQSSSKIISDALVFGAGRQYPGALLFTSLSDCTDDEFLERVKPDIEKVNSTSPRHSRLSRSSITVVRVKEEEVPIPKSSKGTILRRQAEDQWAETINQIYSNLSTMAATTNVPDEDLVKYISDLFREVLGHPVDPAKDVYSQGVDSIACVQIMKQIQASLLPAGRRPLPQNMIYDNGTIVALASRLKQIRHGGASLTTHYEEQLQLMRQLVKKYTSTRTAEVKPSTKQDIVVVLTGATGGLGAHILDDLINDSRITKIYCLLRAQSHFEAKQRIIKALLKRNMRTEEELESSRTLHSKIVCLRCDLSALNLDLSVDDRSCITNEATHIIHAAWTVNFNLGLRSFENQLANTRDLVEIANTAGAKFYFISSTAAVSNMRSGAVPEKVSSEPGDASALGYSQSKWVAEQICATAHSQIQQQNSAIPVENPRFSIIRVGQLCGNRFGVWNTSEAYPLLLSTAKLTACLPDLSGEILDWLPVDIAADAVVEIVLPHIPVYHVLNPHQSPSWRQMLEWLLEEPGKCPFRISSSPEWMKVLEETLTEDSASKHSSQALADLWKQRYIIGDSAGGANPSSGYLVFEVKSTQRMSQSIRDLKPLDRQQVVRMWQWVQDNSQGAESQGA
ncbi:hypothetical protein F5Y08DRAFT_353718 [Xylaria arbuscula]|nr:hypothetical protein F5Y08DRAFT_353718 [Xylaria arbuscula]